MVCWNHAIIYLYLSNSLNWTSVGLELHFSFWYHLGIYNDIFTLFNINRVWMFDGICVSDTIRVYILYKNPSYLGKIVVVSIWRSRMEWIQRRTQVYKYFLAFIYPQNIINVWLRLQYWWVGSLIPLLMLNIDTIYSPIYRSNIGSTINTPQMRTWIINFEQWLVDT